MEDLGYRKKLFLPSIKKLSVRRKNMIEARFMTRMSMHRSRLSPMSFEHLDLIKRTPPPLTPNGRSEFRTGCGKNQISSFKIFKSENIINIDKDLSSRIVSISKYKKKMPLTPTNQMISHEKHEKKALLTIIPPHLNKYSDFSCQIDLT